MKFNRHKFSRELDKDFFETLKQRVNSHFKEKGISKTGNIHMVLKSVVMLSLFLVPLTLMLTGLITAPWLIFIMWILMGLGMGGIGMSVMHDAIHGSYSKNQTINKIMGYTMNIIGANANVWKIQHNVLHHTYTNIDNADDDIHTPSILRFSPHQKRKWIHRFQHIYVWFFYGISMFSWVTIKDFAQLFRYKKRGLIQEKSKFRKELVQITVWKLFYYSYILVLPILLLPVSPWFILFCFFSMLFVTGILLSIIFQTAHVMPSSDYPLPNKDGLIENNWAVHQLATTTNFAPKNKVFSWLIGGLNYQVEHHLFSNICHVHYRDISRIVAETAKEYKVPYNLQRSFASAVKNHVKMLRQLGRMDMIPTPAK